MNDTLNLKLLEKALIDSIEHVSNIRLEGDKRIIKDSDIKLGFTDDYKPKSNATQELDELNPNEIEFTLDDGNKSVMNNAIAVAVKASKSDKNPDVLSATPKKKPDVTESPTNQPENLPVKDENKKEPDINTIAVAIAAGIEAYRNKSVNPVSTKKSVDIEQGENDLNQVDSNTNTSSNEQVDNTIAIAESNPAKITSAEKEEKKQEPNVISDESKSTLPQKVMQPSTPTVKDKKEPDINAIAVAIAAGIESYRTKSEELADAKSPSIETPEKKNTTGKNLRNLQTPR
jgi:hypothetical protein